MRRELANTTPPTPTPRQRCEVPDWFADLRRHARADLADARADLAAQHQRDAELRQRIGRLTRQLADLEPHCAPHDHAIARVTHDLNQAHQRQRDAEHELDNTGRRHRRAARHAAAEAAEDVTTAQTALDAIMHRANPSSTDATS